MIPFINKQEEAQPASEDEDEDVNKPSSPENPMDDEHSDKRKYAG